MKHVIKIKHHDPKYANMQISAETKQELDELALNFCEKSKFVHFNQDPENALLSRKSVDIEGNQVMEYAHSEMFYFEEEDNTELSVKQAQIEDLKQQEADLLKILEDTDYLVIREAETGVTFDQAIKDQRADARVRISEIRLDITALED